MKTSVPRVMHDLDARLLSEQLAEPQRDVERQFGLVEPVRLRAGIVPAVPGVDDDARDAEPELARQRELAVAFGPTGQLPAPMSAVSRRVRAGAMSASTARIGRGSRDASASAAAESARRGRPAGRRGDAARAAAAAPAWLRHRCGRSACARYRVARSGAATGRP